MNTLLFLHCGRVNIQISNINDDQLLTIIDDLQEPDKLSDTINKIDEYLKKCRNNSYYNQKMECYEEDNIDALNNNEFYIELYNVGEKTLRDTFDENIHPSIRYNNIKHLMNDKHVIDYRKPIN